MQKENKDGNQDTGRLNSMLLSFFSGECECFI